MKKIKRDHRIAEEAENPYYAEYLALKNRMVDLVSKYAFPLTNRMDLVSKYAFAIPNDEALDFIASWGPIVEIGAGTGYWASLLQMRGTDVVAYDNFSWPQHVTYAFGPSFTTVAIGTAASAKLHPDRTLFLCWPDYGSSFARDCLHHYRGKRLIYIGEGQGGCTANDHFHDLLNQEWKLVKTIMLPTWPAVHDNLYAYERKRKKRIP